MSSVRGSRPAKGLVPAQAPHHQALPDQAAGARGIDKLRIRAVAQEVRMRVEDHLSRQHIEPAPAPLADPKPRPSRPEKIWPWTSFITRYDAAMPLAVWKNRRRADAEPARGAGAQCLQSLLDLTLRDRLRRGLRVPLAKMRVGIGKAGSRIARRVSLTSASCGPLDSGAELTCSDVPSGPSAAHRARKKPWQTPADRAFPAHRWRSRSLLGRNAYGVGVELAVSVFVVKRRHGVGANG